MATPFRERNPVPIGAIGLLLIGALLVAAFNVQKLPLIGRGDTYQAAFTEVGGLKTGDDVLVAGVKVGKVKKIELDGAQVLISFKVTEPAHFGTRTGAAVKLKTLLGQKYLALDPQGPGQLKAGSVIPTSRTVPCYDVIDAFSDLTTTTEAIDVPQLSKSLDVLATEFKDSPPQVKASLEGLTRLVADHLVARPAAGRAAGPRQGRVRHAGRAQRRGGVADQGRRPAAASSCRSGAPRSTRC